MAVTMATISLTVNGRSHALNVDPDTPLLYVLSDDLELRGPKFGCGLGQCGACTVIVRGRAVRSCVTPVGTLNRADITTLEGLGTSERPHPIQQAFLEGAALQCGICTPGFIVAAKALLDENLNPSEHEIRLWLANNLCRCTGYDKIVRAVQSAARSRMA